MSVNSNAAVTSNTAVISNTAVTSLRVAFAGPTNAPGGTYSMLPAFSDNTWYIWDPSTPVANSIWTGLFCDPVTSLPDTHLAAKAINNLPTFVWAWPSMTGSTLNTLNMPTGVLTLGTVLNTMYAATQGVITAAQYEDVTGQIYGGQGRPTLAQALQVNAANYDYQLQLFEVTQESPTVLRIDC